MDLARERSEGGLEGGQAALRQRHIELVGEPLVGAVLHELETPRGGVDVAAGYGDLRLKTSQLDVRASNVGDDRYENRIAGLRGSQRIQMGGLDLATQLAKDIELPRGIEAAGFVYVIIAVSVGRTM